MYIVLGATGHVGSSVARKLIEAGQPVTVVTRIEERASDWRARGAKAAVVDVCDVDGLRAVFKTGRRAFLLNPPAKPKTDTDLEEHRTLSCIVQAVEDSGLEKLVLESTFGAQAGERIGDLSVLYDFEQALLRQPVSLTVQRAAYYMSNWDAMLPSAKEGVLPSMYPADLAIPMVAPADLGEHAARFLKEPPEKNGIRYVEGPARYSAKDVADAFASALGRNVAVSVTPREQWEAAYRKFGFSKAAADAYARMTAVSVDGSFEMPEHPYKGSTTLHQYIEALVKCEGKDQA